MLKTPLKLLLAASVALPGALLSSAADAGHKKKRYSSSYHVSAGFHYGGHRHYRYGHRPHHYRYGYHPRHHYRGHHHHGKAGKYLGVALLGLGLGYVISKSRERDYPDRRYEREYAPERGYGGNYYTPPPPGYRGSGTQSGAPSAQTQGFDFSQCRETRQYQTTIVIDGQNQEAFGTACLMEDGTWVAGPMQIP